MSVGLSRLPMEESRHAKEVRRRMVRHWCLEMLFALYLADD